MPDDTDDEIRRLRERIEELERLIRQIFAPEENGEEEKLEAPAGTKDLYDVGKDSYLVNSLEKYKEVRRTAANSRGMLLPSLSPSYEGGVVTGQTQLFIEGYNSLDSLKRGVSNKEFNQVIREIVIASTLSRQENIEFTREKNGEVEKKKVPREEIALMIEVSGAKPDYFGISEDVKGQVEYAAHRAVMPVLRAYDSFWFVRKPGIVHDREAGVGDVTAYSLNDIAKPWESLGLETPEEVKEALNTEDPVVTMYRNGVIVGGGRGIQDLIQGSILPLILRKGGYRITDSAQELATFLELS